MKKIISSKKKILIQLFITAALSSCGSYNIVTSPSNEQSVPKISGVRKVNGKPNLHVPAKMGVLTSSRFATTSLTNQELETLKAPGITQIVPINSFVNSGNDLYKMSDLLYRRSEIIEQTKFLGLDLILLCDETKNVDETDHIPTMKYLSLGIINPNSKKTHVQLDAVLMDARTGYIYGAAGDSDSRSTHSLTFVESEIFANASANKANHTAKKQLLNRFPSFWADVRKRYGK